MVVVTALSGSDGMMLYVHDIIYKALLLDNQSVKREQSASSQSRNRPGDILIFLMATLRMLIVLSVTRSLLATSPLLLLEQPVCTEKLLKMLSTAVFIPLVTDMLAFSGRLLPGRQVLKQIARQRARPY